MWAFTGDNLCGPLLEIICVGLYWRKFVWAFIGDNLCGPLLEIICVGLYWR